MRILRWLSIAVILLGRPLLGICEDGDEPNPAERPADRSKTYEYEGEYWSIRVGGGLLFDYANYNQDAASFEQMPLDVEGGIRDLRGVAVGNLPWKGLTYNIGYMLDVPANEWRVRQTGLILTIPELGGFLFVGRTKEGFSTSKFMNGYHGWFNERSTANDAFIPILADGVRWTASVLGGHLVYNVGVFNDSFSDDQAYTRNDWQTAGRVVWLPIAETEAGTEQRVLHLALEARYGSSDDGFLLFRSKPESFFAQSFAVDTGSFAGTGVTTIGVEAYLSRGPFNAGLEYFFNQVSSEPAHDPFFHGGDLFASYLFTGETHPYKTSGAYFANVVPAKSFFAGGPGAWELALRCSFIDLDSEPVSGGKFFRVTPQVNWYLTNTVRIELLYGYGRLDRFDLKGDTHFFQSRLQIAIP